MDATDIGDQAATLVLDAYQQAATGRLRNRVEHAQHLHWADIKRMAQLGVVASMQPTHCTSDIDLVRDLPGDRDIASYAWRSVLDAGAPLAFGSDAPVEEPHPFHGIYAAVTRMRQDGTPPDGFQPEQRLSVGEAISAFTLGSAYAAGEDQDKGALAGPMITGPRSAAYRLHHQSVVGHDRLVMLPTKIISADVGRRRMPVLG